MATLPIISVAAEAASDRSVAEFVVLRIAALPFDVLESLRLRDCEEIVERLLEAERAMEAARPAVEDALHALVPQLDLDEVRFRRTVLNLRRDVHNGRPTKTREDEILRIGKQLSRDDRAVFAAWVEAQERLASATGELARRLPEETQDVLRPALRRPLTDPSFRRALEFANPGMERTAARERKLPKTPWPDSLERALLGYIARAAAKTSPFSSFMGMAVVPADAAADVPWPSVPQPLITNSVNLNRGMVARLDGLARLEAAKAGDFNLAVNPTLKDGLNGRTVGLCNREIVLIGRPWYEQRWGQFKLHRTLAANLVPGVCDSWSGWCARLRDAGIPESEIQGALAKLVDRGLLVAPALTDAFDESPLDSLAARWGASRSPRLRGLVPALDELRDLLAAAEGSGASRIGAIERIREAEAEVVGTLAPAATQPDEAFQNHVLEDCWIDGVEGKLGASLLAPLEDLKDFLSSQVIVSPFYARLRDAFVRRFGEGGTCDDAVDFLLRASDRLIDIPEFGARMPDQAVEPAPEGAAIPVTAHVQIAATADGEPILVPNRVFEGAGWLAARFTAGRGAPQRLLQSRLGEWIETLSGGREPVDVVLGGHCSDLQAHAPITRRVLRWPGEHLTADPSRIVEASDVRLTHDASTGLIGVADRQGVPLHLCYLGATFPSPIWGVRYALSILTQPYLLARPDVAPPAARDVDGITCEAPLRHGSVMLRRRTWWVSTAYLRRAWLAGSEAERLVNVRRDCERWGIPPCFFAQRYVAPDRSALLPADVLNANRKPLWIDVRNPFWLAMLERLAKDGDWVSLVEPVPGPEALWLRLDGRPHVSELHVEMTVQSRPKSNPNGN